MKFNKKFSDEDQKVIESLEFFIEHWDGVIFKIINQERLTIYEYDHRLWVRRVISNIQGKLSEEGKRVVDEILKPLDQQFIKNTMEIERPIRLEPNKPSVEMWWYKRIPEVLVGEIKKYYNTFSVEDQKLIEDYYPKYGSDALEYLVAKWEYIIVEIIEGYKLDRNSYLNDLDIRYLIHKLGTLLSDEGKKSIEMIIKPFDQQFMENTTEISKPIFRKPSVERWWEYRVPKKLTGTLKDDLINWGLIEYILLKVIPYSEDLQYESDSENSQFMQMLKNIDVFTQIKLVDDEVIGWINREHVLREITVEDFDEVLNLLNHKKTRIRWRAAHKLGKYGDPAAVPYLGDALGDQEWLVRLHAAKALGRIGKESAFSLLVEASKDDHPSVRRRAARALGEFEFKKTRKVFKKLLKDPDSRVRYCAVEGLSNRKDKSAIRHLASAVIDKDSNVSWAAVRGLQSYGSDAVPRLIKLLKEPGPGTRYRVIKTLGNIGDKRAEKAITEYLKDPDEKVRYRANIALRQIAWWDGRRKRLKENNQYVDNFSKRKS